MEKASAAGSNGEYLSIRDNLPPSGKGTSPSLIELHRSHSQTRDVVLIHNGVDSEMQHPRYVGHLNNSDGNESKDTVLWATVSEGALAANAILAQSVLHISRILVGIAAVLFYCLDVYVCATLSGSDSKKTQHWDMVALGLCIAGILLCLVDYALVCRTPKWRFAAVGSASSADQPLCIVVVNHQDSV